MLLRSLSERALTGGMQPQEISQLLLETPQGVNHRVLRQRRFQRKRNLQRELANARQLFEQIRGINQPGIWQLFGSDGVHLTADLVESAIHAAVRFEHSPLRSQAPTLYYIY